MEMSFFANAFTLMLALLMSLTLHEAAHAFVAKWQGDRTAEFEGRLTLNPIPHIDPMGTIVFPLAMILMQVPLLIGWAKPVPVTVANLKNRKWGHVLVAAAGPVANLLVSFICIVLFTLYYVYFREVLPEGHVLFPFVSVIKEMIILNAFLAVFNLIPLPPLDGGTVFPAFLPQGAREFFEDYITPYGSFILLVLIFTGGLRFLAPIALAYVHFAQVIVGVMI